MKADQGTHRRYFADPSIRKSDAEVFIWRELEISFGLGCQPPALLGSLEHAE